MPPKPFFVGMKVLNDYDLMSLIDYIDWGPFFQVWQIRGKYPNRGFPKIFNDKQVGISSSLLNKIGAEAKRIYEEGLAKMKELIKDKTLTANGMFGIFPGTQIY